MLGKTLKFVSMLLLLVSVAAADSIPSGARLTVRTNSEIVSGRASAGQVYGASLVSDLVVNGKTLAPAGARANVKVTYAKSSGRLHDPGELTVRLASVQINGKMVPISTTACHAKGKSHTKSNATKIGGGAAAGAILGGIFGGGKGALIGTAAGAGAGTGLAAATGKQEAVIPAESALSFSTTTTTNLK
jgi:hypothetical protein